MRTQRRSRVLNWLFLQHCFLANDKVHISHAGFSEALRTGKRREALV